MEKSGEHVVNAVQQTGNGNLPDTAEENNNDEGANGSQARAMSRKQKASLKYVEGLLIERSKMDNRFPLASKLIEDALQKVNLNGFRRNTEIMADIFKQRTVKLSQKVDLPLRSRKYNYVGKLLGPRGENLNRLQEETNCKIVVRGRYSMKDREREEQLRNSLDPKYAHYHLPLHVEVSTIAPPAEAHAQMAMALVKIREHLFSDLDDVPNPPEGEVVNSRFPRNNYSGYIGNPFIYQGNGASCYSLVKNDTGNIQPYVNTPIVYGSNGTNFHPGRNYVQIGQCNNVLTTTPIPNQALLHEPPHHFILIPIDYENRHYMANDAANPVPPTGVEVQNPPNDTE